MKNIKNIYSALVILLLLSGIFSACDTETAADEVAVVRDERTIAQHFREDADFSLLYRALETTDLLAQLESEEKDQLTLFAPNNNALAAYFSANGIIDLESADKAALTDILRYHLLGSEVAADKLDRSNSTELDNKVVYSVLGGSNINGVSNIESSSFLKNGVVHEVSRVLEYPSGNIMDEIDARSSDADNPEFTLLKAAIDHAGLRSTLSTTDGLTLFAPTDAAFASAGLATEADITAIPADQVADILKYHVLEVMDFSIEITSGRYFTMLGAAGTAQGIDINGDAGVTINEDYVASSVETSSDYYPLNNILTNNGVIHGVDAVLTPVPTALQVLDPADLYYTTSEAFFGNFYDAIIRLQYDDSVVNNLEENFTYLAPRTDIWDQTTYTDEEIKELVDNHLFDGLVSLADNAGSKIVSRNGAEYYVTANDDDIYINGSVVSLLGLTSYNGSLQILSGILDPLPQESLVDLMKASTDYSLMGAALAKTGQIEDDGNYTVFAVTNATFTSLTGISTVGEIDALDPEDGDDAEFIAALEELFANHIVEKVEFNVDIANDLPVLTYLSGEALPVIESSGSLLIGIDLTVLDSNPEITATDVILGNNGVVHEVDGPIIPE